MEVRIAEICAVQVRATQIRALHECTLQHCVLEIRTLQARGRHVGVAQVGVGQSASSSLAPSRLARLPPLPSWRNRSPRPPASALDTEVWRPQRLQVLTLQVRARQIDVLRRPHQLHLPELRRRSVSPRIACFIRTSIAVRFGTVFAAVKFCSEPGRTKREARCAPALRTNHGRIKYRWRSEHKRDERPDRDRGDARKHQHEHVPALRHVWDHARFSRTAQPTCSGFGPRVRS